MEDVAAYAVCWFDVEKRLENASLHLSEDLQLNRDHVEYNTMAKGEISSAITAIEQERIAYDFVGDDASQYFPIGGAN